MGFKTPQGCDSGRRPSDRSPIAPAAKVYWAAAVSGVGWTWAVTLLAGREHLTGNYDVMANAPPLWGNLGLPAPFLLLALALGLVAAIACGHAVRLTGRFWATPIRWLMCSWLIPGLDLFRLVGVSIPTTFLEPLFLAAITGAAAGAMADVFRLIKGTVPFSSNENRDSPHPVEPFSSNENWNNSSIPWAAVVWLMTILCCGWWYYEGQQAYNNYLLGYYDFAQLGWRVVNTWEGRGFLLETPSLPAFWDHFNPGIALLAPLWGIWPDPRLFIFVQAVCLTISSPLVYGIARQLRSTPATSACWAAAYLAFPTVGQLNLNYSYGWHPISLALPLIFLIFWALLRTRWTLALVAAILACSIQEDVSVVLCCLALALAFQAWLGRRRPSPPSSDFSRLPADLLPYWAWLIAAAVLGLAFVAIFEIAPFSKFQSSRFPDLGGSAGEILLSPILRPEAFWGEILRPRCGYFFLCLTIPLGLRSLLRGWSMLLAAALPFGVLMAWSFPPATSIAFQYTTTLIPILFLAAMVGSARLGRASPASNENVEKSNPSRSLRRAGITALAASVTASFAFGSLPWSSPTLTEVITLTYGDRANIEDRLVGSPGNVLLNQVVANVGGRQSAVLATGRIASHLLAVRRLDTVGQACSRWNAFQEEIGPDRSPIELYDWVVLDTKERFYQSPKDLQFVIEAVKRARYRQLESDHGILVFARPEF